MGGCHCFLSAVRIVIDDGCCRCFDFIARTSELLLSPAVPASESLFYIRPILPLVRLVTRISLELTSDELVEILQGFRCKRTSA